MLALFIVFIVTFLFFEWFTSKPKNYPPGPPCIPIVGSILFGEDQRNFHFSLEKLGRKYGNVIGFKFGPRFVIGVSGIKEVREVLSREEFQNRPMLPLTEPGIMFVDGDFWSIQRKFAISHLKEFGFGKKSTENVVLEEAEEFFKEILRKNQIIEPVNLFSISTVNVLWAMIGGHRYSHNDVDFQNLLATLQKRFRSGIITGGFLMSFPFLRKILPNFENFEEDRRAVDEIKEFLQEAIISHKKTTTEEPRDLIDVYLTQLKKPNLHPSFSETTLRNVCLDIFSAGAESMGNNLSFCLLYCVLHPEWQEKLYEEILSYDTAVPYLDGKQRLAKVEAFLSEVSRCNTIAPFAVPHGAARDTHLNGYFIPKDSMILVNLWSVLQDKETWKDPENFRPERFLDENGSYRKDVGWLPVFGMGKRICPGEIMAKNIVFVFFIAMIRNFKFSIPEGDPKPSTVCSTGFTKAPLPFRVKVTPR